MMGLAIGLLAVFTGCVHPNPPETDPSGQDSIPGGGNGGNEDSIPELQTGKWIGGDISLLPEYERFNTPYYGRDGKKIDDLVQYLHDTCEWNGARVRLFVDPVVTNATSGKKEGEIQDLAYVVALGKRIKDAQMSFMLDFHYSDTWADPTKQNIPRAWKNCTKAQLVDSVYGYTRRCLEACVAGGATPDFVQIGNEIAYGMLKANNNDGIHPYDYTYSDDANREANNWNQFAHYLNAGARAVREVCPDAKIIIHIERAKRAQDCVYFYQKLDRLGVDWDIIGLSYYPFWHGDLNVLHSTLTTLENRFPGKNIQIVETAYYNNYFPTGDKNTENTTNKWAASEAGQAKYLRELCETLKGHGSVNGLYYWFPEENGNGGASWNANTIVIDNWVNRGLFDPNKHKAYQGLYVLTDLY